MSNWNFADVWEAVAETLPEAPSLLHGERRLTWQEVNRRANGVASVLLETGVSQQDKVAQYLYNCPEYLESVFACFKAGLVPVNTNYRYGVGELEYLWDDADAVAVIYHASFIDKVDELRGRLPRVKLWIQVDDGSGAAVPDWAVSYDECAERGSGTTNTVAPWGRSGDDIYMLYTGGTTGMPKGVMWRQDDLFSILNEAAFRFYPPDGTVDDVRRVLTTPGPVHLSACPLMHGTGAWTAVNAWDTGGCVVTLTSVTFDPVELLDTVERDRVNVIALVGDAFSKPILAALDADPGRWDLSSLKIILSSGVMWSEPVKQGLLKHHPAMLLVDAFSSSEAIGMGQSISSGGGASKTASFSIGENALVLDEDNRPLEPGSGKTGRLAVRGRTPIGYYKDPEKSARTFPVIDGIRYSVPGDYATVNADGSIQVLGRGSQVINTGGEKVYPEEVEEVLKLHPSVRDASVVGVPDERFGEAVWAVVEPPEGTTPDADELIEFVKQRLAGYKAPKGVVVVDRISRSPSGKMDYAAMKKRAVEAAAS